MPPTFADGDPIIPDNSSWGVPVPGRPLPYDALFPNLEDRSEDLSAELKNVSENSSGKFASSAAAARAGEQRDAHPTKHRRHDVGGGSGGSRGNRGDAGGGALPMQ